MEGVTASVRWSTGESRSSGRGSGSAVSARHQPGPLSTSNLDSMVGTIMDTVGITLDARFSALEDRLLPEKSFRPPLGGKPSGSDAGYKAKAGKEDARAEGRGGGKVAPVKPAKPSVASRLPPSLLPYPPTKLEQR